MRTAASTIATRSASAASRRIGTVVGYGVRPRSSAAAPLSSAESSSPSTPPVAAPAQSAPTAAAPRRRALSSSANNSNAAPCKFNFPNRKEGPIITRSASAATRKRNIDADFEFPGTVADTPADSDATLKMRDASRIPPGSVDRFDDLGALSVEERSALLGSRAAELEKSAAISSERRIGTERPAYIPANEHFADLEVPEVEITTLSNGVRVGSMETYGQVACAGVISDFGSRHELDADGDASHPVSTNGVNHLMEMLAFQSTSRHTAEEIVSLMDHLGGATFASAGREQAMHCVDVLRPNVGKAVEILAETVLRPQITEMEVEEAKNAVAFQLMDIMPQVQVGEGLQAAGYGHNILDGSGGEVQQLGRNHFCTAESLPHLTTQSVNLFREKHLLSNPNGIVIAGAGISHDALVELAEANFGSHVLPANDGTANILDGRTVPSTYTGGEYRLERPTEDGFTRVAMAFEVGGWDSQDLVPVCVLQTLLGGGSSFSAGGPGKGMYSRLYREVLNRYHWTESAEAFTSFHSESGLWGISGACPPERARDLVRALAEHFVRLAVDHVTDEELYRARNMLKCNVLTQLESRLVLFEDIGRQILTYGKREDAATMCGKIDNVTKEDIRNVVRKALLKPPTLSAVGDDVSGVPRVAEVETWLAQVLPKESWF